MLDLLKDQTSQLESLVNLRIFNQHELPFDVMSIHFTYYVGHHHGSKVEKKYRVNNNYWEGKITVELFGNSKNIRCVFPNCANDCIQISLNGDKSIKGRFIQKKKH